MDASVFVREPNSTDYDNLGNKEFSTVPRLDEFISTEVDGKKKFYQIVALHHVANKKEGVEIYAVHTDPPWEAKKTRTIGFGS